MDDWTAILIVVGEIILFAVIIWLFDRRRRKAGDDKSHWIEVADTSRYHAGILIRREEMISSRNHAVIYKVSKVARGRVKVQKIFQMEI